MFWTCSVAYTCPNHHAEAFVQHSSNPNAPACCGLGHGAAPSTRCPYLARANLEHASLDGRRPQPENLEAGTP